MAATCALYRPLLSPTTSRRLQRIAQQDAVWPCARSAGAAAAATAASATAAPRPRRSSRCVKAQAGSGSAEFAAGGGGGKSGSAAFAASTPAAAAPAGGGFWNLARLQQQVQTLGLAGVVAYGIFNTLYYTVSFLVFWCWVVKVPTGQGLAATAKAFAGVMAGVWAGSQVTKAPRAAAALMLAPLVDRLMGTLQGALGLRSRRQVFFVFVAGCVALALALFAGVVLAWS